MPLLEDLEIILTLPADVVERTLELPLEDKELLHRLPVAEILRILDLPPEHMERELALLRPPPVL